MSHHYLGTVVFSTIVSFHYYYVILKLYIVILPLLILNWCCSHWRFAWVAVLLSKWPGLLLISLNFLSKQPFFWWYLKVASRTWCLITIKYLTLGHQRLVLWNLNDRAFELSWIERRIRLLVQFRERCIVEVKVVGVSCHSIVSWTRSIACIAQTFSLGSLTGSYSTSWSP